MAIALHDILVAVDDADYSFNNPVPLLAESRADIPVGYADLLYKGGHIYATLYIEDETKPYIEYYPEVQYDATGRRIVAVNLLAHPNKDSRIEKITDQELFQSSSGAGNTEMH